MGVGENGRLYFQTRTPENSSYFENYWLPEFSATAGNAAYELLTTKNPRSVRNTIGVQCPVSIHQLASNSSITYDFNDEGQGAVLFAVRGPNLFGVYLMDYWDGVCRVSDAVNLTVTKTNNTKLVSITNNNAGSITLIGIGGIFKTS